MPDVAFWRLAGWFWEPPSPISETVEELTVSKLVDIYFGTLKPTATYADLRRPMPTYADLRQPTSTHAPTYADLRQPTPTYASASA